jgi:hypothetical protein
MLMFSIKGGNVQLLNNLITEDTSSFDLPIDLKI